MKPEDVRARLDHPVIDVDGHIIEQIPEFQRHLLVDVATISVFMDLHLILP